MHLRTSVIRTAAIFTLAVASALTVTACGKYSLNNLKAMKAFKDANDDYRKSDFKGAADKYEETLQLNPNPGPELSATYFFLGNSYDQLYKPAKKGDPANEAYLQKAVDNYKLATERVADPALKKLSYQYLIGAYGSDKLNDFTQAEPLSKHLIELEPNEPVNYQALGKMYEDAGRYDEAEAMFRKAVDVKPDDPGVYLTLAGYYNRQGKFDKTMDALAQRAAREPNNPEAFHYMGSFYQDEIVKDFRLTPAQKKDYINKGLAVEDKALALNPQYFDAMIFKSIFLFFKANNESNPAASAELRKEGNAVHDAAMELQKKQTSSKTAAGAGRGK